ncbi:MAG: SDR family NAD(P)-dependent oxidoreductase [Spirochaetota bacterium]
MELENRLVVITGATSGIGAAFARHFSRERARLVLCGRREAVLSQRDAEARSLGAASVETIIGDLADEMVVQRILEVIETEEVAALVNNAGFGLYSPIADADPEALRAMVRVQAEVPMRLAHAVTAGMRRREAGLIINVGSLAGRVAVPGSALYVSTKVYLERLSETLALELARHGIVVQALTPGYVRTDFHRDIENYRAKRRNRGLIRWMDADRVVACSVNAALRAEKRLLRHRTAPRARDVVVIPGLANRVLAALAPFIPRTVVYRAAASQKPM